MKLKEMMTKNEAQNVEIQRLQNHIKQLSAMEMKNKQDIDRWYNAAELAKAERLTQSQRADKLAADLKALQLKHDGLQIKYLKLEEEYRILEMGQKAAGKDFEQWGTEDVLEWVLELDGGKFKKYEAALAVNVKTENIDGSCLGSLDKGDLHRLGVTDFKDKAELLAHIQERISPVYREQTAST